MKIFFFVIALVAGLGSQACKPQSSSDQSTSETGEVVGSNNSGEAYTIDAPRSQVKWTGFKPTGSHHGIIPISSGTIYVDGQLITGGNIELNMADLVVQDLEGEMKDNLEAHLKGTNPENQEDFFRTTQFPTATFTIKSSSLLENDPLGTHMINGDLTIKDITQPVSFKSTVDLSSGSAIKATTEPFVIDRTLWDIKFKSKKFFDSLKDDFINDEIKLDITVGAVKKG